MHSLMGRFGILAVVFSAALAACGGPLRFTPHGTPKAPDAEALIVADIQSSAALTKLQINVEHLAPPERLFEGGSTFVVWARKNDGNQWQRVGALEYKSDPRTGELLEASVPLTSFDLAITVETQPAPPGPSPAVVVFQKIAE